MDMSYLNKFVATVGEPDSVGLHFEIKKRIKYLLQPRKMKNQGVSFEEVYDKYAIPHYPHHLPDVHAIMLQLYS